MSRCYDLVLRDTMVLRALIAVALVMASASAGAQWRGVATSDRPGFPVVEVECGYPGGYLSASGTPIRMRARTGSRAFDGYIGFRLEVDGKGTVDVPVISRAQIPPHSEWTFSTWLDIRGSEPALRELANRELVVEWRDVQTELLSKKSAGKPPWSHPRPLRIVRDGEVIEDARLLGGPAVVIPASALSTEVQWYAGFSSVVVPTKVWFELPEGVREAIFRSGLRVHFFGPLNSMPSLSATDRALLPVELASAPGSAVGVTWRAKAGANVAGVPERPDLVVNAVAVWASSEEALREPLPGFAHGIHRTQYSDDLAVKRRTSVGLAETLREYRPLVVFSVVVLTVLAGWLAIRRVPKGLVLPALVIIALVILLVRPWVRPIEGSLTYSSYTMAAPDVVDVRTVYRDYGMPPRTLSPAVLERLAGGLTRRISWAAAEVRRSDTLPGLGTLRVGWPWVSFVRRSQHRQLGSPAVVRVVSQSADQLVVDFESSEPVDYVVADWTWNGANREGVARAGSRRGRVTVHHRRRVFLDLGRWVRMSNEPDVVTTDDRVLKAPVWIVLFTTTRHETRVVRHFEPAAGPVRPPYLISANVHEDRSGVFSAALVLPGPVPERGKGHVRLDTVAPSSLAKLKTMTLQGPGGSMSIEMRLMRDWQQPEISTAELQRIAPAGGIVRVTVDDGGTGTDLSRARVLLRVSEEKQ